jgi:ribosomal protein S18 acetylase RimI-like enzyme
MKAWTLRPLDAGEDDRRFLAAMLYEAATWGPGPRRPPGEVLADPDNARYVTGWGREGDFGLVAVSSDGERLGAAWYRCFPAIEQAYGFVAVDVPEVSVAVRPRSRGQGIGTALVSGLIERAREEGLAALSLSVEDANPALGLYRKLGFRQVRDTGDGGLVLHLDLGQRPAR